MNCDDIAKLVKQFRPDAKVIGGQFLVGTHPNGSNPNEKLSVLCGVGRGVDDGELLAESDEHEGMQAVVIVIPLKRFKNETIRNASPEDFLRFPAYYLQDPELLSQALNKE